MGTSALEAKPELEGQVHVICWACALRRKAAREAGQEAGEGLSRDVEGQEAPTGR